VIAHDSRHFSKEFSEEAASVLAANGIKAYLFDDLRPTPELSFAVSYLNATAGVVVTASHNPSEYNGYKVYWDDGAQIVPPHDTNIINEVRNILSLKDVKRVPFNQARIEEMVEIVGTEIDDAYLKSIKELSVYPELDKERGGEIHILYTPMHGAGIKLTPRALEEWGFSNVTVCAAQEKPDGDFPSVESPNPEDAAALVPALTEAREKNCDIVLASDPDCDRLGIVCRQPDGTYMTLRGNQCSSLICYFILNGLKEQGRLPQNPAIVTTIVTTTMVETIARAMGTHTEYTLTGFKWICERARIWENMPEGTPGKYSFIYGTEESLGHVVGTSVRDKDGVIGACIAAEIALWTMTQKNKTIPEFLDELGMTYGIFTDTTKSIYLTGASGKEQIGMIMETLRNKPPRELGALTVEYVTDILEKKRIECATGDLLPSPDLPESNVLILELAGGNRVIARPSGTEPKIKFYFLMQDTENLPIANMETYEQRKKTLEGKMTLIIDEFMGNIDSMIST
jgi:phosphoglucomutase